jgi:NIPSNAP
MEDDVSYKLITALVTLALGIGYVAGREMTVAAQGQRVLEIRTYVTPDKTGLDNLVTRMRSEAKIFDRLGMKSVLYSTAAEAPQSDNTFVYILSHESREKAKENWSAFGKDAEWAELRKKSAPTGQIKITSQFVTPTDFSPAK